jgi:hypothetical protein
VVGLEIYQGDGLAVDILTAYSCGLLVNGDDHGLVELSLCRNEELF